MSRRRNTYKNKTFFISLFIAGVAVAVLMGVTLVLGASVQRAHGDISVGYVANNVNCTAQAWYQVAGSNTKTYFTDGNENTTLSFTASSQQATENLVSGNVSLNSDHDYCLVTFMFRNNAPAGGDDVRLSLTDSSVKTNIATYYYVRTYTPSVTLSTNYNDAITGSTSVPGPVYIKPGCTIYYEIVIKIADLDYSASYSASSGNGILWLLENSEFSKSYQTVEYIESTGEQYIDTGVNASSNLGVAYKIYESTGRFGTLGADDSLRHHTYDDAIYGFSSREYGGGQSPAGVEEVKVNFYNDKQISVPIQGKGSDIYDSIIAYKRNDFKDLPNIKYFMMRGLEYNGLPVNDYEEGFVYLEEGTIRFFSWSVPSSWNYEPSIRNEMLEKYSRYRDGMYMHLYYTNQLAGRD